jgi:predicted nucleotidyltransferase
MSIDLKAIKINLERKRRKEFENNEKFRLSLLTKTKSVVSQYLSQFPGSRAYLFGSILSPNAFSSRSDIDIAFENCPQNRLDLHSQLTNLLEWPVDIVILEKCNFKEHILKHGQPICTNPPDR